MKPSSTSRRSRRRGFTLLELLLAAAISTVVLAGVGGLILIIYRIEQTSSRDIHLVQTGHNLLRQFDWDLQAIAGRLVEEEGTESMESSGMVLALDSSDTTLDFGIEAQSTALPFYLVGDTQVVEFLAEPVSQTGRQLTLIDDPLAVSDIERTQQRLLVWGFNTPGMMEVELTGYGPDDPMARFEALSDAELVNIEWLGGLPVPELVSMEFLYFDGIDWYEEWDSTALETLPKAIQVTAVLQITGQSSSDPNPGLMKTVSRVIAIPTQRFVVASTDSLLEE
ncbi:prepilin-type N-terminal cleavage/methylation domain-containing protein [Rubinisphaera margarita]|uniref:prepilin-type N-terminal cleavage/methylation domain-containing protein n=1 Tax=Rubinisphaera margarita TaxID=2909586 RepID=UPI001EE7EB99|nr:prepilin-type N-terminal cleavage/methylation domain-containing protein [Rubinisphaera margarita]MCG6154851.1 prepilin-type N-terminal cleavage/methylation domain-containing protein [Rubinisphaera margarita]